MADPRPHPVLHYLRRVLGDAGGEGVADAELLRRFVQRRDEAAFELLLWRHAAMVLHTCRQVLRDAALAEDAFQATFLVFVRRAASIRRREALASWLYRVAYRTALKARAQACKHAAMPLAPEGAAAAAEDAGRADLRRLIGEEVDRLPAKYRAPVVACFFEGRTHEEAARQLGWPRGTVAGRLARARELLRRRLLRRGVALTTAALAGALAAQAAPAALVKTALQTAKRLATGTAVPPPRVAALTEGVLRAMYWTRIKIVTSVVLLVGLGGAGTALWATPRQQKEKAADPAPQGIAAPAEGDREAGGDRPKPEDAARLERNKAISRRNLKQLALAMQNHHDTFRRFPSSIVDNRTGKALLSWRVAILPYIEQQDLYRQFKLDEPWDSPHNRKLLSKMPKIYAPPGVTTRQPYSTFYQVFVSVRRAEAAGAMRGGAGMSPAGRPGMGGGPPGGGAARPSAPPLSGSGPAAGGAPPAGGGSTPPGADAPAAPGMVPNLGFPIAPPAAGNTPRRPEGAAPGRQRFSAFIKGEPTGMAHILDGTSNTILLVEAGNPVPWTKPEDLHYADDEPLPELGGLFPDVFHAALADGSVRAFRKKYDEEQLRRAITANDGEAVDWDKLAADSHRPGRGGGDSVQTWRQKNQELRKEIEQVREQLRQLREEREIQRELEEEDPRVRQLRDEHAAMQAELKKLRQEIEALKNDRRRPRQP